MLEQSVSYGFQKHCDGKESEPEILECLENQLDRDDFEDRCRRIVLQRQIAQTKGKIFYLSI